MCAITYHNLSKAMITYDKRVAVFPKFSFSSIFLFLLIFLFLFLFLVVLDHPRHTALVHTRTDDD